ncbi:MAG: HEPN domain-containing protein [candidate division WOR-3 bacterium]
MNERKKLNKTVQAIIKKANRILGDAKILYSENRFESTSSRAYYSVFHIMQAALLTKGLSYSKHSGVIAGFSQHFIKNEIFPKEFANWINELREDREIGDYDYEIEVSKAKAKRDIEIADKIIKAVERYIQSHIKGDKRG